MTGPMQILRRQGHDLQFWGYEIGNLVALVTSNGWPQLLFTGLSAASAG